MIRRQARLRREYLHKKGVQHRQQAIQDRKDRLKDALEHNRLIDGDLRRDAIQLASSLMWTDKGPAEATHDQADDADNEYRWTGVDDPRVMITTCRDPSARLKKFAKELRLIFPNSQRLNRGNYDVAQLVSACRAHDVTDIVVVHEHRGQPDGLIVSHLPHGPTAYFTLSDVVMRHDISQEVELKHVSEQYPHLIFHNFKTRLGLRIVDILKHLFAVPKPEAKRVVTFANCDDSILFRHHTFSRTAADKSKGDVVLDEIGPRFQMRPYQIKLGTLETEDAAPIEWSLKPFMNTAKKRRHLSHVNGLGDDDTSVMAASQS